MAHFLLQTLDGELRHDFSFALRHALEYQNRLSPNSHTFFLSDSATGPYDKDCIPSGSVEFVHQFLQLHHGLKPPLPLQIPAPLWQPQFLKRNCRIEQLDYLDTGSQRLFVKSVSRIKGYTELLSSATSLPPDRYFISDCLDIVSEWRAFVHAGELVGLQNYSGDFTCFPDVELILQMIAEYKSGPIAWTLDVGIDRQLGTFLLETHRFYSCGLYGFEDYRVLPQMVSGAFRELLR